MASISARERLCFQSDIALTLAGKNTDAQMAKADLAMKAYEDDPKTLGQVIESISRK